MESLPSELIDKILSYLDGLSLARSECVCRTWRGLHNQKHYKQLWKQACLKEFSLEALADITGCTFCDNNGSIEQHFACETCGKTNENLFNSNVLWKEVYKECYRSWFIGKWPSLGTELKGHQGPVNAVKFSGDRIVTCGADTTVRIWDSWTGGCLKIMKEHTQEVTCLALRRRNGVSSHADHPHDLIISGSEDFTVCIWDMQNAKCIKRFRQSSSVNSVAVQGFTVIAGCKNNTAEVWDINQGNVLLPRCIVNTDDWIRYVGFWKNFFLTVTEKNKLEFWSSSGEHITSYISNNTKAHISGAVVRGDRTLALSFCGNLFAWEHKLVDGEIDFSVLRGYTIIAAGIAGILEGTCLAIYGSLVAIGTRHGMINVYHLENDWDNQFQFVHTVIHSSDSTIVNAIDISDDGKGPALVSGGHDGIVRVERWFPWPSS